MLHTKSQSFKVRTNKLNRRVRISLYTVILVSGEVK